MRQWVISFFSFLYYVLHRNRHNVTKGFRDIEDQMHRGHDLDLTRSLTLSPVAWPLDSLDVISYRWSHSADNFFPSDRLSRYFGVGLHVRYYAKHTTLFISSGGKVRTNKFRKTSIFQLKLVWRELWFGTNGFFTIFCHSDSSCLCEDTSKGNKNMTVSGRTDRQTDRQTEWHRFNLKNPFIRDLLIMRYTNFLITLL